MNTFAFLEKSARQFPDSPALVQGGETVTYREFRDRALAIGGNLLASGCQPGDRVAFCLANSPRILELIYGCFAAGLVVVPVNSRLHAREIAYIVGNSGAKVLVHGPEYQAGIVANATLFADVARYCLQPADGAGLFQALVDGEHGLAQAADAKSEDLCWLFYTSGTTGKPKGAMWNHRMVRCVIMNYLADLHNIQPGEVVLHCAPLSHGSGIIALPTIARGGVNAITETASFDIDSLLETVARLRVSHIAFMAPTQIVKLLEDYRPGQHDISSLQAICYGGAPIYVDQLRQAIETFGPIFVQLYGQGESPITITGMSANLHRELLAAGDPRIGSAGRVRTDVEAHCVDARDNPLPPGQTGEVVVRGDVVMPGYWRNPEATAEALRGGWLHTGDVGYFDDRGFLFLLDRAKDMVISGGNNVYPREVEEAIILHPKVANCVVFGIPDDYWGEAVHAVVVAKSGETLTAKEIIDFCGEHMAGYKKPKAVDFVEELPVSGYGKILRREIREKYWVGHASRIGGGSGAKGPNS
ncbi:long-chain fatty acid--CoA ligase [Novosphingobium sp. Fuku2-ISO-50]|uniref:acyl-CoA synthetase n=1 Tax=Novosphingobium sp. Fuku2-ISO-50 TaxID=1739114 RepID=UPI00076D0058|nr:long-chain fatty acid--CoA ligase [Novosphingobium sp. Fuku2-ISO-50]KUR73257.1 AMP-dependent synthetase [Novosphingobium sp. Fuku2-ISO-50]